MRHQESWQFQQSQRHPGFASAYLQVLSANGDRVELETEGLGRLHFGIRDDLKRTWSRETRLDRQEKGQEGTTPQLTGKYKK